MARLDGRAYDELRPLTITPDSVSLFGHRKVLDTIPCVYTSLIEENNIKDTLQWRASLQPPKALTPSEVEDEDLCSLRFIFQNVQQNKSLLVTAVIMRKQLRNRS